MSKPWGNKKELTFAETAVQLGVGRNKLLGYLRSMKILNTGQTGHFTDALHNTPRHDLVRGGYFVVRQKQKNMGLSIRTVNVTYVTNPKGLIYLRWRVDEYLEALVRAEENVS